MTASETSLLFSWDDVNALADLQRLDFVRSCLPDEAVIAALEAHRGRGRNDSPVAALWRALVAGVVFQHPSVAALVRELQRKAALLDRCGFNPLPTQGRPQRWVDEGGVARMVHQPIRHRIPGEWTFSRLLVNRVRLEEQQGLVSGMVDQLRRSLMDALPDYGKHLGADGKAIWSHSTGQADRCSGEPSDPEANGGKHKTRGIDRQGRAWEKVKTWFGYGLPLIADTPYERPVSFRITPASASEPPVLGEMIKDLKYRCPAAAYDLDCTGRKACRGRPVPDCP